MPRFFFDIHDGAWSRDTEGMECTDVEAACHEAKRALPGMAVDQVPQDGERHLVYTATLSFAGLVLKG